MPRLMTATELCEKMGVSKMSLWRWENDKELDFPKPVRIKTNRYWPEHEIAAWLEGQRAA